MAISLVVVASRPPEWTQEEFTTWWRGDHADMARQLPGLIAYRHGRVTRDYDSPESPAWDGHAVLTFASRDAFDAAMASEMGRCRPPYRQDAGAAADPDHRGSRSARAGQRRMSGEGQAR